MLPCRNLHIRLSVLIIEKGQDGGQIAITDEIENYPGQIVEGESGPSLIARMTEQAAKFGAERVSDTIKEVELNGDVKVLKSEKAEYQAKNVIIATGAHARPIGCKGEAEFMGKGVSYCATCDANFFEDFEVYVVGGGDSAVEEAMYLTKFARKVTIIHRRNELRAAKSIQEKAFKNPKLHFMWDSVVEEVGGDDILQWMKVKNVKTGEITQAMIDGIDKSADGEVVFKKSQSVFFKTLRIRRIFDAKNQTLVYLSYSTKIANGSFKHSISSVPLWGSQAYKPEGYLTKK